MSYMKDILLSSIPLAVLEKLIREIIASEMKQHVLPPEKVNTDYITRKEAASILGVSLPTLALWAKRGIIPSYRISSRVRYKRNEVENSLNKVKSIKHSRERGDVT